MAKELDLQSKIKKSARQQGGYGQKLSNRFSIGIPDLLIGLPLLIPCYVEVKDLGIVADKFDRTIGITPKQAEEMRRLSEPYEQKISLHTPNRYAACILAGIRHRGQLRLVALSRRAERLDHTYEASVHTWVERGAGGFYDIAALLKGIGIARVDPMS